MRLVWFEVNGYGRLSSARVNLDARVVAVLGANESGKSTLLQALRELSTGDPIDPRRQTRGEDPGNASVEGWFLLDSQERSALEEQVPEARDARWYVLSKACDGKRTHCLEPSPERSTEERSRLLSQLEKLLQMRWGKAEAQGPIREVVELIKPSLSTRARQLDDEAIEGLESLCDLLNADDDSAPKARAKAAVGAAKLLAYEQLPHPSDRALEIVDGWCPRVLLFEAGDRFLESEYELKKVNQEMPAALGNLVQSCGLDTVALMEAILRDRPEVVEDMLTRANTRLRSLFEKSWSQSSIEVRFSNDSQTLRLFVRAGDGHLHRVAERSDGLRMYVCLVAFLTANESTRPILLIDEAEQHLHWDAQADLVGMLHRQDQTGQVVYSTHSPGCLPQDLGAGLRLALQRGADRSVVSNAVWAEGKGFAPLLMAMGATTAALTPARRALVTEGGTEFVLLPALLREAGCVDYLEFQVVPGLAEASSPELRMLDLEAARVAYLADGDKAGDRLRSRLVAGGVEQSSVVQLPTGMVLEDFVSGEALTAAVHEELRRSGCEEEELFSASDLPEKGRPAWIARRLAEKAIATPSKTNVAARLVEMISPPVGDSRDRATLVEGDRIPELVEVLLCVRRALQIS